MKVKSPSPTSISNVTTQYPPPSPPYKTIPKPYQRRRVRGGDRRRVRGFKRKYEMLEEGRGQRVPRSRGPKDQDISNSHSNTSLTLKKVHLV